MDGQKTNDKHQRFSYQNVNELKEALQNLQLSVPVADQLNCLNSPLSIGRGKTPNRLAIQPMEGCDGMEDGRPSDLTFRRYERFARGGAGVIWVEANAVVFEGRANPRQLTLTKQNQDDFAKLVKLIDKHAPVKPYKVLQLTHSGRYSRPVDQPFPQVACRNTYLDKPDLDYKVMRDDELDALIPAYAKSAGLAAEAGFDAVDIKACHGYLISELLGAHSREGKYGGSFVNRTRFLLQTVAAVRQTADIDIAVRMNAYDEVPYPYGWGVSQDDYHQPDWQEMRQLIKRLKQQGVSIVNLTGGNPYYNPHVNRPYDAGPYKPPFHQLTHAAKLLEAARQAKQAEPELKIMATGFSWLRDLAPYVAAGMIEQDWCDLAGFGRQAFAYPDYAADILAGGMNRKKCCIACGKCSEIMRDGGRSGCVIFDGELYQPIYRAGRAHKPPIVSQEIREHV